MIDPQQRLVVAQLTREAAAIPDWSSRAKRPRAIYLQRWFAGF